jgi:hypothetical protein
MQKDIFSSMRPPLSLCVVLFLAIAPLIHAQGGPPFITDDPGTPGDKHWEINVAWSYERRAGENVNELPLLDLNYGVGDRIQLKYEVPYLLVHETGSGSEHGLGNSEAGIKWRFYDDEKKGLTISTYPQLEFRNLGSNSASRGLAADETTLILPLEIQWEAGEWGINGEIGAILPGKSASGWSYGIVVGHQLNARCEVGVELHGEGSHSLQRTELAAVVGVRCKVNEHCFILASLGREMHNHFEPRATLLSYLAVQCFR